MFMPISMDPQLVYQERMFPLRPASAARVFSPVPVPFQTQHHNHPVLQHYNSFQMEIQVVEPIIVEDEVVVQNLPLASQIQVVEDEVAVQNLYTSIPQVKVVVEEGSSKKGKAKVQRTAPPPNEEEEPAPEHNTKKSKAKVQRSAAPEAKKAEAPAPGKKEKPSPAPEPVEKIVEVEKIVTKEVPVDRLVFVEVPVETVVYRDSPPRPAPPPPPPPPCMVGLGLLLVNRYEKRNSGSFFANSVTVGRTFIGEIVPGFAAYRSGQFQEGDIIVAIDQTKVDGMPLDNVRTLTVGPEGTFSTVQILRGDRSYSVTLQRITPPTLDESNYDCALEISGRRSPVRYGSPVRCGSPVRYSGLDALEISDRRSQTHIQNVVEYVHFPVQHTQATDQIISGDLSTGCVTIGDTTYRYSGGSGRNSSPPGTVLFSVHSSPPETVFEPKGYSDSLVETPQPSHFRYFSNSFLEVSGHELITT